MTIGMHRTLGVLLAACALTATATSSRADGPPGTIHVVAGAMNGDGQTWATAFGDLQAALAAARSNPSTTQIWLAGGTYTPAPVGQRQTPFELVDGVPLFGGFEGDENTLADRPPLHEPGSPSTVLSGDLAGDDAGLMNLTDNAQRILLADGHDNAVEIDGVVIRGAYWADVGRKGLGLYVNAPGLTLRDVIVEDNRAEVVVENQPEPGRAGGVGVLFAPDAAVRGDPAVVDIAVTVERCIFRHNAYNAIERSGHAVFGAGLFCDVRTGIGGTIDIADSVFEDMSIRNPSLGSRVDNEVGAFGAGVAVYRAIDDNQGGVGQPLGRVQVRVTGSRFENNGAYSRWSRGGAFAAGEPYPTDFAGGLEVSIESSQFFENVALPYDETQRVNREGYGGGAVFFRGSGRVRLDGQIQDGGGVTVSDSVFERNRVWSGGSSESLMTGAGAALLVRGGGELTVRSSRFADNLIARTLNGNSNSLGVTGGTVASVYISLSASRSVSIESSEFMGNRLEIGDTTIWRANAISVFGAGVAVDDADADIRDTVFRENEIVFVGGGQPGFSSQRRIGGAAITIAGNRNFPSARIVNTTVEGSRVVRESGFEPNPSDLDLYQVLGTAIVSDRAPTEMERTRVLDSKDDNIEEGTAIAPAVFLNGIITNSEISGSRGNGLVISNGSVSRTAITNNTIEAPVPTASDFQRLDSAVRRIAGGGINAELARDGSVVIDSCLIADNQAPVAGGIAAFVWWSEPSSVHVINTTVAGNTATGPFPAGLGLWGDPFVPPATTIANTILWGNTAAGLTGPEVQLAEQFGLPPADQTPQITRLASTTIQDWLGPFDDGVSNADPLFVDAPAGDYRLQPGSPALDSGNNTLAAPGSVLDLDGSARFIDDPTAPDAGVGPGPIVDRGAYERGGTGCPADLAAPFGDLTFADIARFLQAFANGEPGVDGAEPFGQLTFADIAWYLAAFAAGCGS